jgi:glycosyltransferase involved in cell wall biosynthesis
MRVCHIVNNLSDTTMAGDLAIKQLNVGDVERIDIVCWRGSNISIDHADVHVYDLSKNNSTFLKKFMALNQILNKNDLIHVHHTVSGVLSSLIATPQRTPIVVTDHNSHHGYETHRLIVDNVTSRLANQVVCVSDSVRKSLDPWELKFVDKNKLSVIYNGVEPNRVNQAKKIDWSIDDYVDIDSGAMIVSSAGMLIEQKAQHVLVDAVSEANRESEIPIELVISGSGRRKKELSKRINHSDFSDHMHLLGFLPRREQVYKMMHESEVYAMPSLWEGFCVAALEAMAAGNACVFSDIDSFRPFHDVALLHQPGSVTELKNRLIQLAENPDKRQTLAQKSKELVNKKYTIEKTAEEYNKLYKQIV